MISDGAHVYTILSDSVPISNRLIDQADGISDPAISWNLARTAPLIRSYALVYAPLTARKALTSLRSFLLSDYHPPLSRARAPFNYGLGESYVCTLVSSHLARHLVRRSRPPRAAIVPDSRESIGDSSRMFTLANETRLTCRRIDSIRP